MILKTLTSSDNKINNILESPINHCLGMMIYNYLEKYKYETGPYSQIHTEKSSTLNLTIKAK